MIIEKIEPYTKVNPDPEGKKAHGLKKIIESIKDYVSDLKGAIVVSSSRTGVFSNIDGLETVWRQISEYRFPKEIIDFKVPPECECKQPLIFCSNKKIYALDLKDPGKIHASDWERARRGVYGSNFECYPVCKYNEILSLSFAIKTQHGKIMHYVEKKSGYIKEMDWEFTVPCGHELSCLALSKNREFIYAAAASKIYVIDMESGCLVGEIENESAIDLVRYHNNNIYAVSGDKISVYKVDLSAVISKKNNNAFKGAIGLLSKTTEKKDDKIETVLNTISDVQKAQNQAPKGTGRIKREGDSVVISDVRLPVNKTYR